VIQELRAFISGQAAQTPVDLAREIDTLVKGLGGRAPAFVVDIDRAAAKGLPWEKATQLLQIAREGLSNIVRHANATSGRIGLKRRGRKVALEISDDGEGFDVGTDKASGLGLHHIAARVQKLGGKLTLTSSASKGSRILVEIAAG
jgi:signal transduction histidine kinase